MKIALLFFSFISPIIWGQRAFIDSLKNAGHQVSEAPLAPAAHVNFTFKRQKIKSYSPTDFDKLLTSLQFYKNPTCVLYVDKQNHQDETENQERIDNIRSLIATKMDTTGVRFEMHPTPHHKYGFDPIFGGSKSFVKAIQKVVSVFFKCRQPLYLKGQSEPFTGYHIIKKEAQVTAIKGYKNGKRHGTHLWYWSNGSISEQTQYFENNRDGIRKTYYRNGTPKEFTTLKNGENHGFRFYFNTSGAFTCFWYYENGEMVVKSTDSTFYKFLYWSTLSEPGRDTAFHHQFFEQMHLFQSEYKSQNNFQSPQILAAVNYLSLLSEHKSLTVHNRNKTTTNRGDFEVDIYHWFEMYEYYKHRITARRALEIVAARSEMERFKRYMN